MENTPSHSALVLLSGGLDSTVLLHHVSKQLQRQPIHALSFQYGQRHTRELDCAQKQAVSIGVAQHHIIDLNFLGPLIANGSSLITGGAPVPDLDALDEAERHQPSTYVPNRNMMLLSMAAAYAEAHGIYTLYYGAQAQDEYGYWDCTPEFLTRINAVLSLNRKTPVTVEAPLMRHSKADNVRLGLQLGVDFSQTWSCYRGGDKACGTCPTCIERLNAFQALNETDPLPYS